MNINIENNLTDGTRRIHIEITELMAVKHIESRFEAEARKIYEKTKSMSDLLFWLSEWKKTEEEI